MSLPAFAADYLFIAPLLKQRLEDLVPGIPVEHIERPEQILAADKRAKVLMVMWAGDRFDTSPTGRTAGVSQTVYQRWLVVLGINNVGTDAARAAEAGPLLSRVHLAVAGWKPEGAVRPFLRANAPLAPNFTPSKAVLPLGFEISLSI